MFYYNEIKPTSKAANIFCIIILRFYNFVKEIFGKLQIFTILYVICAISYIYPVNIETEFTKIGYSRWVHTNKFGWRTQYMVKI